MATTVTLDTHTNTTTYSASLTTSGANRIAILSISYIANSYSQMVTGVTGGGLTWNCLLTDTILQIGWGTPNYHEIWYANVTSAVTAQTITIALGSSAGACFTTLDTYYLTAGATAVPQITSVNNTDSWSGPTLSNSIFSSLNNDHVLSYCGGQSNPTLNSTGTFTSTGTGAGAIAQANSTAGTTTSCSWNGTTYIDVALLTLNAPQTQSFVVTNLLASGVGSFASALYQAGANPGANITFQSGLSGTITTTSVFPWVVNNLTITGPGAGVLTIDCTSQNFLMIHNNQNTSNPISVSVSGLNFTNGAYIAQASCQNTSVSFSNCTFSTTGSAFYFYPWGTGVSLSLSNCTFANGTFITQTSAASQTMLFDVTGCTFNATTMAQLPSSSGSAFTDCIFENGCGNFGCLGFSTLTAYLNITGCSFYKNVLISDSLFNGNAYSISTITNCTFYANSVTSAYAISNNLGAGGGSLTLTSCTISGNTTNGLPIVSGSTINPTVITDCIIWGDNLAGAAELGPTSSYYTVTYSDIYLTSGVFTGTGNINVNPLLGIYQNNGGSTSTIALSSISPCLAVGTATGAPATDQRGTTRPNPPSMGAWDSAFVSLPGYTTYWLQALALAGDTIQLTFGGAWCQWDIYRGTTSGGETLLVTAATTTNNGVNAIFYTDNGLTNGTTYYYKIAPTGTTTYSNESSATAIATVTINVQPVLPEPKITVAVKPLAVKPIPNIVINNKCNSVVHNITEAMSQPKMLVALNPPKEIASPAVIGRGIRQGIFLAGE